MVINTTRWSPDTCSCELEYSWDTAQNENQRTHSFAKIVRVCSAHNKIVSPGEMNPAQLKKIYDVVLEENTRKNQALGSVLDTTPELAEFVDGKTGKRYDLLEITKKLKTPDVKKAVETLGGGLVLKENVNYRWRWIEDKVTSPKTPRTLEIDFEVPVSVEDVIAAKTTNPDLSQEQIMQQKRQRAIGDTAKLQEVLDEEFTPEKGRGKVKVKTGV